MPKKKSDYYCPLVGCRYHTARQNHWEVGDCNYLEITGHSKLGRMTPEQREQYSRGEIPCPCFDPGRARKIRTGNDYVFPRRHKPGKERAVERMLYDRGLNDYEIARAIGVRSSAVWLWRRNEGLPPNAGVGAPPKKKEEEE
jgi:hypothetical protein